VSPDTVKTAALLVEQLESIDKALTALTPRGATMLIREPEYPISTSVVKLSKEQASAVLRAVRADVITKLDRMGVQP
jgi:aspartate/methionine/tyrosine aminotransferase